MSASLVGPTVIVMPELDGVVLEWYIEDNIGIALYEGRYHLFVCSDKCYIYHLEPAEIVYESYWQALREENPAAYAELHRNYRTTPVGPDRLRGWVR